ncbi:MAG: COX15/CtaA family protein [Candidatus Thiodiazotropha sp. 6PLUC5]
MQSVGYLLTLILTIQIALGITNVLGHLPLSVAVAHNGGAAILLLILVTLIWISRQRE